MRSAVILLSGESLCLIERVRDGRTYYLFPGGKVEAGESPEQAARREALEELGLEVVVKQLVAEVHFGDARQLFYAAETVGGVFGSGRGEELASPETSVRGSYRPVWLSPSEIENTDVRPKRLVEHLLEGALESAQVLRFTE